ncbi:MAG: penicillin-insensitive murein endopeptidase [Nannocystis sp.]|uniref:penicillin-insensitive murein endopeptidase n=1 Tax=Nannocystis sp. TaxID=1962667 RepID=UPI002421FF96|nr:penicillin-insensitive murein endopeptidase [Nannocystis sp.]MBK9756279.1 penicillin-insensitive murein endopeptidase [Nannocystis sp.]
MSGALTALLFLLLEVLSADPAASSTGANGDPACDRWREQTTLLDQPGWIVHVVRPRERVGQIAVRYGVSRDELAAWNRLPNPRARVRAGTKLKVLTDRVPPPREQITYTVAPGDTWTEVAIRHRVAPGDLKGWNLRSAGRPLAAGMHLKVWIDPGAPRTVNCRRGEAPSPIEFRKDAESRGSPSSGRLLHGILLPLSALWRRGKQDELWASSHTLATMIEAFTRLRVDSGYDGEVFIASISRRRGGKFRPHRSHRTGLDIDIRLPLLPTVPIETYPTPDTVDWPALWELIEALIDTGEVSVIFLDQRLQEHLYWAARWDGKTPEELAPIIHWPRKDRIWEVIVRHARNHKGHMHVRLLCGRDEPRCTPRRDETLARRGWIEPRPSGKESREGARARREAWVLAQRQVDGASDSGGPGDDAP